MALGFVPATILRAEHNKSTDIIGGNYYFNPAKIKTIEAVGNDSRVWIQERDKGKFYKPLPYIADQAVAVLVPLVQISNAIDLGWRTLTLTKMNGEVVAQTIRMEDVVYVKQLGLASVEILYISGGFTRLLYTAPLTNNDLLALLDDTYVEAGVPYVPLP